MTDLLIQSLDSNGIEYKTDFSLKRESTFRIGGACRLALFPRSTEQIVKCISLLDAEGERFWVVGKGSNTLFSDKYINSAIIFCHGADRICIDGEHITAEAGVSLVSLCSLVAREGLSGLEFASGIPGSVGGAVFMNAGAYGGTVADVVASTLAYDRRTGKTVRIYEHEFGYRTSVYMSDEGLVCLEADIKLSRGNTEDILLKMRELAASRREKQPLEYPSAGSYFKRPDGDFAGRLIEAAGLKGTHIGDAEVSVKHAGFIINKGNASFEEIMQLEELVRLRVKEKFGVTLEREVRVIK